MNDPILKAPLEEHLRSASEDAEGERMWRSYKLRSQSSAVRHPARWGATGAVVFAAAAALWLAFVPAEVGPLRLAEGHDLASALTSHQDPTVFDLEDGSRIVLARETDANITQNTAELVVTRLRRGRATFDVEPGGPRRWVVEAGATRVRVVGTKFSVARIGDGAVEVSVERGIVEVEHPSLPEVARLTAGDSLVLRESPAPTTESSAPTRAAALEPGPVEATASVEGGASPSEPTPAARPQAVAPRTASRSPTSPEAGAWRARARSGDYAGAYRLLGDRGIDEQAQASSSDDLMLLADVARRSGRERAAARLLARVRDSRPGDPRAAVAAFSLGRLELDRLGDPSRAARSFAFVRNHPSAGVLAPDATALEARARARAGQGDAARATARRYLELFPTGRHVREMQELQEGQ